MQSVALAVLGGLGLHFGASEVHAFSRLCSERELQRYFLSLLGGGEEVALCRAWIADDEGGVGFSSDDVDALFVETRREGKAVVEVELESLDAEREPFVLLAEREGGKGGGGRQSGEGEAVRVALGKGVVLRCCVSSSELEEQQGKFLRFESDGEGASASGENMSGLVHVDV